MLTTTLLFLVVITMVLAALIAVYPNMTRERGGKILAFFPLFVLPLTLSSMGSLEHVERSKRTEFCMSCHAMTEHGKSLNVDDPAPLPASHFQNNRVPRETACFTCHTDYTMYGDLRAKLRGLRHVYVQYLGTVPSPTELKLYNPYNNRECLHCHDGARSFEEAETHKVEADTMAQIKSNSVSCLSCHDVVHAINALGKARFWSPRKP